MNTPPMISVHPRAGARLFPRVFAIAPAVGGVLREQLERLVAYVNTGRPDAPAARDGADGSGAGATP
jgi:hypothetical protein